MSDYKGTKSPTATSASSYAAAISRVLRKNGFHPIPNSAARSREGVRVTQGLTSADSITAHISANFVAARDSRDVIDAVVEVLHEAGHQTRRYDDAMVSVIRGGDPSESLDVRHLQGERDAEDVWHYPEIRSVRRTAEVTKSADQWRPIDLHVHDRHGADDLAAIGLSPEDALKLAEQLYHAATGKQIPR